MQTIETHGTFEDAISKVDPQLQLLARNLRDLIAAVLSKRRGSALAEATNRRLWGWSQEDGCARYAIRF